MNEVCWSLSNLENICTPLYTVFNAELNKKQTSTILSIRSVSKTVPKVSKWIAASTQICKKVNMNERK